MATQLSICNNALYLVGADEMNTLEDETREARVCNAIYPETKDALISRYPWNFSLAQVQLARLSATPLFDYTYAYQLPTSPKCLRVLRKNARNNDYRTFEDMLFTDDDAVEIIYQFSPAETTFPAYVTRCLEYEMAKILALALLQDESQATVFDKLAEREFMRSKTVDAQSNPPLAIDPSEFSLVAVR